MTTKTVPQSLLYTNSVCINVIEYGTSVATSVDQGMCLSIAMYSQDSGATNQINALSITS